MDKDPKIYIENIQEAINKIGKYVRGLTFEQFIEDDKTHDAVIRQLETIGEASTQLEEEFKQKYPNLPWKFMQAMRNKLIHEYFGVDLEIVWQTITESLPELEVEIKKFENIL